jgi:hypothetical protein
MGSREGHACLDEKDTFRVHVYEAQAAFLTMIHHEQIVGAES